MPFETDPLGLLKSLYATAIDAALPAQALATALPSPPIGRTVVVGAGKAAGAMAQAVEALWPAEAPLEGLVVTRYGHTPAAALGLGGRIRILEASHPVPDAAGVMASAQILEAVRGLTEEDLVLCLISGGGSALLSLPAEGMSLEDKQALNQALLACGADIAEMNCVRKHVSAIKGGRLAAACWPARVVTLAISDIPGDDPAVIASGPTLADETTCADALAIIDRYQLPIPRAIRERLQSGELETPKPDDPRLHWRGRPHPVELIATPLQSLQAAAAQAEALGLTVHLLSDEVEGESRDVGRVHAAMARSIRLGRSSLKAPCLLLSGGETTVRIRPRGAEEPRGIGGRATEFALGLALGLKGMPGVYGLAGDTDGIDGVGPFAGAVVRPSTLEGARTLGLQPERLLDQNRSAVVFEALGDLLITGPTHTNVNDFRAVLVL